MGMHETYISNPTPVQMLALKELVCIQKSDHDLYQSRHNFRLKANELVKITHRITVDHLTEVEIADHDHEGNPYTYMDNDSTEFFYHIFFSKDGHIWFLVCDNQFPIFGKDISYRGEIGKEYDWIKSGHGSRYYFFNDVVFPAVTHNFIQLIKENFKGHYVWNHSEFSIIEHTEQYEL